MSERELERLYAGLVKLAALPDEELRALVGSLFEGEQLASSEKLFSRVKLARQERHPDQRGVGRVRITGTCY